MINLDKETIGILDYHWSKKFKKHMDERSDFSDEEKIGEALFFIANLLSEVGITETGGMIVEIADLY